MTDASPPAPARKKTTWSPESVGAYITENVPVARMGQTLREVEERIRTSSRQLNTVHYIHVCDDQNVLRGIFSIRELLQHPPETLVSAICKTSPLHTIRPTKNRERAVYLALKHNIKSVPVVDKAHRFLGIIPSDKILRILYKEMREDLMHFAGIYEAKAVSTPTQESPISVSLRQRLPWLLIGMIGGLLSASVIGLFEATLTEHLLLAAFIPLIVYTTNAVALQMTAYLIRDIALELDIRFMRYFLRQFVITAAIAVVLSLLLILLSFLFYSSAPTALVLGIALFFGILSSVLTGCLLPYAFHSMRLDPADASGPIGTIIQDNVSIILYFGIAALLL